MDQPEPRHSEKLEKPVTVDQKTPPAQCLGKVQGVDLKFAAGLPFPVPAIIEFKAFGLFCGLWDFAGVVLRLPRSFKKIAFAEFLSERFSQQSLLIKPQFWYPPQRFGSQNRIPRPPFVWVFRVYTTAFASSARRRSFPEAPLTRMWVSQDEFDHDKGQKSAIPRHRLHWNVVFFFLGFFFSPQVFCAIQ